MSTAIPRGSATPIRVVVIDDHPMLRAGVKLTLEGSGAVRVVAEAGDGNAALQVVQEHLPDVVVVDLMLPMVGGIDVIKHLARELPGLKIIAYSKHTDRWWMQEAMTAGASGYVFKHSPESELLTAIRRVVAGERYVDSAFKPEGADSSSTPVAGTYRFGLSAREAEVLRHLARGTAIKMAAAAMNLSPRTFETYKQRGMQKLQLRSRGDLIRFAAQCGWLGEVEATGESERGGSG